MSADAASGDGARFERWPKKRAAREALLAAIAADVEPGRDYTEREVDAIIVARIAFDDHVLVRRELVVHGLLRRVPSGARYWRELPGAGRG